MVSSYRIVLFQACSAVVVAAGLAPLGIDQAVAALLAGGVAVAPNAYFAWRAETERSPERLLAQGVGKMLVTAALMAAVFATVRPAPLGFFAAFIAIQVMHAVGASRATRSASRRNGARGG